MSKRKKEKEKALGNIRAMREDLEDEKDEKLALRDYYLSKAYLDTRKKDGILPGNGAHKASMLGYDIQRLEWRIDALKFAEKHL